MHAVPTGRGALALRSGHHQAEKGRTMTVEKASRDRVYRAVAENQKYIYPALKAVCMYCYEEGQTRPDPIKQDFWMGSYSGEVFQQIFLELLKTGAIRVSELEGDWPKFNK